MNNRHMSESKTERDPVTSHLPTLGNYNGELGFVVWASGHILQGKQVRSSEGVKALYRQLRPPSRKQVQATAKDIMSLQCIR